MIIDADCHISKDWMSIEKHLLEMEKARIDKSLTWINPYTGEPRELNPYVYEASKRFPDRILGFGWVNPKNGVNRAIDEVKRCIYEYGFYGVKLNGAQNGYYIDDPVLSIPVIEEIARTNKILAFHVGADAFEHTHPFRVAKIAEMFPELKILVVHMGGVVIPDMSDSVIEFAKKYKNMTLVGSAISPIKILKAIKTLGADRLCFGSDSPFGLMYVELAKYNALLDREVSVKDKEMVMGGNIQKLFELKKQGGGYLPTSKRE